MKKSSKQHLSLLVILIMLVSLMFPVTAYAADAEWRMMHGEQDALVLGNIKEETEAGFRVEVAEALWCEQDTAKGRMIPIEEVPSEMIISIRTDYQYSYHGKTTPEVGDHIFISVDKKGDVWEQQWLVMEGSCADSNAVEFAKPENMRNSEYAWQLFVNSGGETTSFAFEGEDILYVGEEIVFETDKYREEFARQEEVSKADEIEEIESDEYPVMENDVATIGIIGGADGPTSIFIAGKLGRGVQVAGLVIGVLIAVALITGGIIFAKRINKKDK